MNGEVDEYIDMIDDKESREKGKRSEVNGPGNGLSMLFEFRNAVIQVGRRCGEG